jgi:hypothetical protein
MGNLDPWIWQGFGSKQSGAVKAIRRKRVAKVFALARWGLMKLER